jgi:hypothetical protein
MSVCRATGQVAVICGPRPPTRRLPVVAALGERGSAAFPHGRASRPAGRCRPADRRQSMSKNHTEPKRFHTAASISAIDNKSDPKAKGNQMSSTVRAWRGAVRPPVVAGTDRGLARCSGASVKRGPSCRAGCLSCRYPAAPSPNGRLARRGGATVSVAAVIVAARLPSSPHRRSSRSVGVVP